VVNYSAERLDRTFAALADPTRRALLARLERVNEESVSALAEPFEMTLPAVMKHLTLLEEAGLVARSKQGRVVTCRLTPKPLEEALRWLDHHQRFWSTSLDRLKARAEMKAIAKAKGGKS